MEINLMRIARALASAGAAALVLFGTLGMAGPAAAIANGAPAPPEPDPPPEITGTAQVGQTLTVSTGTWTGISPTSYTYQWHHCDSDPCTDITGATNATYELVAADIGHMIGATVTAHVSVTAYPASSDYVGPVAGIPPTGPAPTIAGTAQVGQTLTATVGEWTGGGGALTYAWSWGQSQGESGGEIEGATSNTYTVTPADVGSMLTAVVTVTGPLGTGYGNASIGPVIGAPAAGGEANVTNTGNSITVSGSGFAPDSDVTVILRSDPVTLGVAHTDASGNFTATFALPAGVTPGAHMLVFVGFDAAGNPVTVEQAITLTAGGTLPVTGVDNGALTLAAAGLIFAGALALRAGRRRASRR
jgi:LPXTG-motif cell wall-anchored protein